MRQDKNIINKEENLMDGLSNSSKSMDSRKRCIVIILLLIVALTIAAFLIVPNVISKNNYNKGIQAIYDGEYDLAVTYLEKSSVKDAPLIIEFIHHHQNALEAYDGHDYQKAYEESLLVFENYPRYNEVLELNRRALDKLCRDILKEAKDYFEDKNYIDAYDSLKQVLRYNENHKEALLLLELYKGKAKVMEAEKEEGGFFLVDGNSIRQREYVNIDQWHKAGYTGKGLVILHDDTGNTMHSLNCQDILQTILPDAKIIRGSISGTTSKDGVSEAFITPYGNKGVKMPFDEFIETYNISMINNSTSGGKGDADSKWSAWMNEKIKKHNLIGFGSAGNSGDITNKFYGSFIMVSGIYLKDDESIINYGSKGDIDFSMFMGYQSGTSYASPFLCGMAGLLRGKYPGITQKEVYEYFKNHSQKLGTEGKNIDYGWGLPILGNPDE